MNTKEELLKLLERSDELEIALQGILSHKVPNESARYNISRVMCSLSREHCQSCRLLIANMNLTSAQGLIRLQYESYVRAMWVAYAAKDSFIDKMVDELDLVNSKRTNNQQPMLTEMLKDLDKAVDEGKAPAQPVREMHEMKDSAWSALNSLVHSGMHAYNRHKRGYPVKLVADSLKASNNLLGMAAYLMAILSDHKYYMKKMTKYQVAYSDCFLWPVNSPSPTILLKGG